MKNVFLIALSLLAVLCGFQWTAPALPKNDYPLYIYNFGGLTNYTPQKQVELLTGMGYGGMALSATTDEDMRLMPDYLTYAARQKNFKIYAAFIRYNFNDKPKDKGRWKEVVNLIAGKQVKLWVIFGPKIPAITDADVDSALKEINDYAAAHKVPVILYPHSELYIETAEQALPFVLRNKSPNLKLAVHLYHEIRAGNTARITEVLQNVKPYIGCVTLAGTDSITVFKTGLRMDTTTIKPLYRGNYDLRKFLSALKAVDYKGPVGFINFKITDSLPVYLSGSILTWNQMKKEIFN